jgi:hypothetical protein
LPAVSIAQVVVDLKETPEMDRFNSSTSQADRLLCAMELSNNSSLLGIRCPDRQKASVDPTNGRDGEVGLAKLLAARDPIGGGHSN